MISWDVNNGIARRSWARNEGAKLTIERAMKRDSNLEITISNLVDSEILDSLL
jgi:urocanate hydratase